MDQGQDVIDAAREWARLEEVFYQTMQSGGYVSNAMITPILKQRTTAERRLRTAVAALESSDRSAAQEGEGG